ncbi:MAG: L-histidine N(alpha)-methyltransferase [Pseudomonadota bacterium]
MAVIHKPYKALSFFADFEPPLSDFRADALAGLSLPQKALSPKYFYDEHGSALFDKICATPEYYPTRTETALLELVAPDIAAAIGPDAAILEYGSGSSVKIITLLNALERPAEYVALDISREHLIANVTPLTERFPNVPIGAVCADFTQKLALPDAAPHARRVGFFPGSTIGNFEPDDAIAFLRNARATLGENGLFVLGADLKKDETVLNAAYNDAGGVTAAFNLNLLTRMKRELDAVLNRDDFEHYAFYNAEKERIEMHLRALKTTKIEIDDHVFAFTAGETLHTENSHKFQKDNIAHLAQESGFHLSEMWTDAGNLFSISLLSAA